MAEEANIRAHGPFNSNPAKPDAQAARKALLLVKKYQQDDPPHGVLLIRDDDRDTRRRDGLEQARNEDHGFQGQIVIGLAHSKRECWVLAGYDPANDEEEARFAEVQSELGFDPRTSPDRLNVRHGEEARNAKVVVDRLTQNNPDREARCWLIPSLATLRERGQQTGLTDFLDEVTKRLVPLFGGPPPKSRRP